MGAWRPKNAEMGTYFRLGPLLVDITDPMRQPIDR